MSTYCVLFSTAVAEFVCLTVFVVFCATTIVFGELFVAVVELMIDDVFIFPRIEEAGTSFPPIDIGP